MYPIQHLRRLSKKTDPRDLRFVIADPLWREGNVQPYWDRIEDNEPLLVRILNSWESPIHSERQYLDLLPLLRLLQREKTSRDRSSEFQLLEPLSRYTHCLGVDLHSEVPSIEK